MRKRGEGGSRERLPVAWVDLEPVERRRQAERACWRGDVATLCSLTDAYLDLQRTSGASISPHTSRSYSRSIALLLDHWSGEELLQPSPTAATRFLTELEEAGVSPSTIKVHLAGVRALYRALLWVGAVPGSPFAGVRTLKEPVQPVAPEQPYTEKECERLLAVAEGVDRAMLLLFTDAGLRVSECIVLTWQDIDLETGRLAVPRSERGVAVSHRLLDALRSLPSRRGPVLGFASDVRARQRMQHLCEQAGVSYRGLRGLRPSAMARDKPGRAAPGEEMPFGAREVRRDLVPSENLDAALNRAVVEARRTGSDCGLLLVDLDQISIIRREHGDEAAQAVLATIEARLNRTRRPSDYVARTEGARFAVLLKNMPSDAALQGVAHRVSAAVHADPVEIRGKTVAVTAAIGATLGREEPERLLQKAGEALRRARVVGT